MGNMSYCRFENTLRDLQDCHRAMNDGLELSQSEQRNFIRMVELCRDITDMYEGYSEKELKAISSEYDEDEDDEDED